MATWMDNNTVTKWRLDKDGLLTVKDFQRKQNLKKFCKRLNVKNETHIDQRTVLALESFMESFSIRKIEEYLSNAQLSDTGGPQQTKLMLSRRLMSIHKLWKAILDSESRSDVPATPPKIVSPSPSSFESCRTTCSKMQIANLCD
jgi:hypothetical protein